MLKMVISTEKNLRVLREGERNFIIRLAKLFDLINYVRNYFHKIKKYLSLFCFLFFSTHHRQPQSRPLKLSSQTRVLIARCLFLLTEKKLLECEGEALKEVECEEKSDDPWSRSPGESHLAKREKGCWVGCELKDTESGGGEHSK